MEPKKRNKKRKAKDPVVCDEAFLRKGFDAYFETLKTLKILCKDKEIVETKTFALIRDESQCITNAYDQFDGVLDFHDTVASKDIKNVIEILARGVDAMLPATPGTEKKFMKCNAESCTGVLQALEFLDLKARKSLFINRIIELHSRAVKDNYAGFSRSFLNNRVDFIAFYNALGLPKDKLYWSMMRYVAFSPEKHKEMLAKHKELFATNGVFEEICLYFINHS